MALTDTVKQYVNLPSLSGISTIVILLVVFIVIGCCVGIILYFYLMKKKYKYKVIVFEKVGKTIEPNIRDTAATIKLNEVGDLIFVLRHSKKKLPMPNTQTGRSTYWFYIRQDGEWINIGIEDIDNVMKEMNVNFLDKEMRYARSALQKNLGDRYQKPSFWKEYGAFIMYAIFIVIIGVMVYLSYGKMSDIAGNLAGMTKNLAELTDKIANLMDAVKGSGTKPAAILLPLLRGGLV